MISRANLWSQSLEKEQIIFHEFLTAQWEWSLQFVAINNLIEKIYSLNVFIHTLSYH